MAHSSQASGDQVRAVVQILNGFQNARTPRNLFKGHSKFHSSDVYLQSLPVQRFLPKNGMTKFWKRIATALV